MEEYRASHVGADLKFHGISMDLTCVLICFDNICLVLIIVQWEFQDPKLEVLYHIRPYFVGIFPYIALT